MHHADRDLNDWAAIGLSVLRGHCCLRSPGYGLARLTTPPISRSDGRCKDAPNVLPVGDRVRLTVRYRMKWVNNRMEHSQVTGGSHRGTHGFWVDAMVRLIMNGLLLALASVIFQPACAGNGNGNTGMASFYGGIRASSGEFTAAHRSLRFGTRVRVVSVRSGRSVVVRINDRGPFIVGRIIDLSRAAAAHLNTGLIASGRSADFIVLDANPLDNIANSRKINRVYLRGQEVDRAGLRAKWQAAWKRCRPPVPVRSAKSRRYRAIGWPESAAQRNHSGFAASGQAQSAKGCAPHLGCERHSGEQFGRVAVLNR